MVSTDTNHSIIDIPDLNDELINVTNWQQVVHNTTIYQIQLWTIPFLVIFGGLGNLLSLWVFCSASFRGHSSSCYLASLALSDTLFLITLLLVWISNTIYDLFNVQGWCQSITYLTTVATFVSVWLIVAFTVERFIAVCYPLLRSAVCTVRRARIVVGVLVIVAITLYSYLLFAAGVAPTPSNPKVFVCTLKDGWGQVASIMNTVDTVLTLVIPVGAVVTLNILIARCVYYVDSLGTRDHHNIEGRRFVSTKKKSSSSYEVNISDTTVNKSRRGQQNVTKMLLVISTIFVLLNLPSYVMRAYLYFTTLYNPDAMELPSLTLYTLEQTFTLLFYSNFAVNFLLYCVTGQNFRRAVTILFFPGSKGHLAGQVTRASAHSRLNASPSLQGSTHCRHGSQIGRPNNTGSVMLMDLGTEGSPRQASPMKCLVTSLNTPSVATSIINSENEFYGLEETHLTNQN